MRLLASHSEIHERFVGPVRLAVMVSELFGDLDKAVVTAALHFFGDPEMQRDPPRGKETLVERVAYQRVLEFIGTAASKDRVGKVQCLYVSERNLDVALFAGHGRKEGRVETSADCRGRLQECAPSWSEPIDSRRQKALDA
jgi:hypothetical protein